MRTIDDVLSLFPNTVAEEWHQEAGWVHRTSKVDPESKVKDDAVIGPYCTLYRTVVEGRAIVGPNCQLYCSTVGGEAKLANCRTESVNVLEAATVNYAYMINCIIFGTTVITGDNQRISIQNCFLSGGLWTEQPISIALPCQGRMVCNSAPGRIMVGCEDHEFSWWVQHGERMAQLHLDDDEIPLYRAAVLFIIQHGRPVPQVNDPNERLKRCIAVSYDAPVRETT